MKIHYYISKKYRPFIVIASVVAAALLNAGCNSLVQVFNLPIFLDSVFTVLVAALMGLWPGIAVGLLSNLFMEIFNGFPGTQLPFAAVNIATAVLTAVLAGRGLFGSLKGILITVMILAVANSVLGALIVTIVFGGITGENVDQIVRTLTITGETLFNAAFLARILINVVDKGISVLIVYPAYQRAGVWIERKKAT